MCVRKVYRSLPQTLHVEDAFYAWQAKYSGMTVSEARRLKALKDANAKLKRRLAEQMLDMAMMKELLPEKW